MSTTDSVPGSPAMNQFQTGLAVDANATTPAINASAAYAWGDEFSVAIAISSAGAPYHGYQVALIWDPTTISLVSAEHLRPSGLDDCAPINKLASGVFASCSRTFPPTTDFAGAVIRVVLRCQSIGQAVLHLVPGGLGGTTIRASADDTTGFPDLTTLDATVYCE